MFFSKAKFVFPLQKQERIVIGSRKNVAPEIQSYEIRKLSAFTSPSVDQIYTRKYF